MNLVPPRSLIVCAAAQTKACKGWKKALPQNPQMPQSTAGIGLCVDYFALIHTGGIWDANERRDDEELEPEIKGENVLQEMELESTY